MGKKGTNQLSAKEERRRAKAEKNREHEKKQRAQLDKNEVASFSKVLLSEGFDLKEVDRDGNCFFRSLCDQLEGHEGDFDKYRQRVMEYVAAHEGDYAPFMSFGESEEEEDKDFEAYIERLKTDGEWAGQVELIAAAQALRVHIVVHQYEHPSYRIECPEAAASAEASPGGGGGKAGKAPAVCDIHLSYHDGEHYNSVRPLHGFAPRDASCSGKVRPRTRRTRDVGSAAATRSDAGSADEGSADDVDELAETLGGAAVSQTGGKHASDAEGAESDDERGIAEGPPPAAVPSPKLTPKLKRKEEKRLRKEQRHKEAVAAAGGAADESEQHESGGGGGGRTLITL